MCKRIRKKKYLGEFAQYGYDIVAVGPEFVDDEKSWALFDEFDRLIDALDITWSGWMTSLVIEAVHRKRYGESITLLELETITDWMRDHGYVYTAKKLDLNYGKLQERLNEKKTLN